MIEKLDPQERSYLDGQRSAYRRILRDALGGLSYSDEDLTVPRLIEEREQAIAVLRLLCADFGDNDWDATMHLGDIIDKHLGRYLRVQ